MTSIIHFTPISGGQDQSPPCYLLQIDEFQCLLDCGFDETFDINYVQHLKPYIGSIDAVLLSHPDIHHLGALPYLVGKLGLSCDVYATTPVFQMGQMFAYDLFQSRNNYEDFELFTLDDIDLAFERVTQVKYNQSIVLKGRGQGITLTPLPAGHMVGGTIWRIVKDGGEDIIYAADINHKAEQHLNGCDAAFKQISRPSLFITDCINVDYHLKKRKERDDELLRFIQETARSGGNVLVALDTAGRSLEIAHLLERAWADPASGLQAYSLVLLNNVSYNVMEFAKSMMEWMADRLMRQFEGQRSNPFAFRHLQLCHDLAEVARVHEPAVILASQPDLECGFSRELFFSMAANPKNTIIFTQRPSAGTLADRLLKLNRNGGEDGEENSHFIEEVKRARVPLTGRELDEYLEARKQEQLEKERAEAERRRAERARRSRRRRGQSATGEPDDDDDDDDDSEDDEDSDEEGFFEDQDGGKGEDSSKTSAMQTTSSKSPLKTRSSHSESSDKLNSTTPDGKAVKHDLLVAGRIDGRPKGGGFFRNAKKSYPMFPCIERKLKWDEYGEIINPEDYSSFDVSRMGAALNGGVPGGDDKENLRLEEANGGGGKAAEAAAAAASLEALEALNPTKCTVTTLQVAVLCRLEFIDFEGRTDDESLKRLIIKVNPRRLILVRGEPAKIAAFKDFCVRCFNSEERTFTPQALEPVDATTERHIYQIKLKDALVSSLSFSAAKNGAQLAWVDAEVTLAAPESLMPAEEAAEVKKKEEPGVGDSISTAVAITGGGGSNAAAAKQLMPSLQQLPPSSARRLLPATHQTIFINELKLSDFKQILSKAGVQAEFADGVLLCSGGQVEVRRSSSSGRIVIAGTVCEEYFKVRRLLYAQYAIL